MIDTREVRVANVVLRRIRDATPDWVVISCPYCGKEHRHLAGGDIKDPYDCLGQRRSHCSRGGEYLLVPMEPRSPWKPRKPAGPRRDRR